MKPTTKALVAAMSALAVAACSGATEEAPTEEAPTEEAATEEAEPAASQSETSVAQSTEVFEVCDADGNRYPSEADAEAAGLERAEYGATFCEYAE